jgi:hypothetical protein
MPRKGTLKGGTTMEKNGTASIPGWYTEFQGAVLAQLPRDIEQASANGWVKNQEMLKEMLLQVFSPTFANDKRKDGWELVKNIEFIPFSISKIKFVSFLKSGEDSISGEKLVGRAKEMGANGGQIQAEYLLKNNGILNGILKRFEEYYIPFVETIWRDPRGVSYIPCIFRQKLVFNELGPGRWWCSGDHLPQFKK